MLIPLDQAVRHPSVVSANHARKSSVTEPEKAEKGDSLDGKAPAYPSPAYDDTGLGPDGRPKLTLESLRAEVESDLAAGGHDTAYDSTNSAST